MSIKSTARTRELKDRKMIRECLDSSNRVRSLVRLLNRERHKAQLEAIEAAGSPSPRKSDWDKISDAIHWTKLRESTKIRGYIGGERQCQIQERLVALLCRERARTRQKLLKELDTPSQKTDWDKIGNAGYHRWPLIDLLRNERARVRRQIMKDCVLRVKIAKSAASARVLEL